MLSGYGLNCEKETLESFKLAGAEGDIVHVNDLIAGLKKMSDYDILVVPGGFSYGDDTGSGNALANKIRLNLWEDIKKFVEDGKLILGICNGCQVLALMGLIPGFKDELGKAKVAFTYNGSARLECRWVRTKIEESKCVFTKGIDFIDMPVAHGEGRFYADKETLDKLKENNQVVGRYVDKDGNYAKGKFPFNPNSAMDDVMGICDETGRILGLMPHPERAVYTINAPFAQKMKEKLKREGKELPVYSENVMKFFKNAVEYVDKE